MHVIQCSLLWTYKTVGTTQRVAGLRHGVFDLKWRKIHVFLCDTNHDGFYCCHLQFSSALHTSFCKPCHPTATLTKCCPLDLDHGVVAPAHSFTDKPRGICAAMDTIAWKKENFHWRSDPPANRSSLSYGVVESAITEASEGSSKATVAPCWADILIVPCPLILSLLLPRPPGVLSKTQ